MEVINEVKGVNGQISIVENRLEIKRKGFTSFLSHGFDGTKSIFISKITAIQFKEAGAMTNGFIQFAFSGSSESKDGLFDATKDENTVMFNKQQQSDFEKIRDYLFSIIK